MSAAIDWRKVRNYIIAILVPVVLGGLVGFWTSQFMDYEACPTAC